MSALVLASQSASRQAILRAAGVPFEVLAAHIDEEVTMASLQLGGVDARGIADALAELKALRISAKRPSDLVLGADQVLLCDGNLTSKATNRDEARAVLKRLRGRKHQLIGVCVMARNSVPIWRTAESADMWMRDFSDAFLENYLDAEGQAILSCVGCYRIEGLGAQLFEKISGDVFAIRGLPLLPILDALRRYGILEP